MPYKWTKQHKRLPPELDRRIKITPEMKADIIKKYDQGEFIRVIARAYPEISRRSIQLIIFPDRLEKQKQYYKDREQWKENYSKVKGKKWAEIMRDHRRYKQINKDKLI